MQITDFRYRENQPIRASANNSNNKSNRQPEIGQDVNSQPIKSRNREANNQIIIKRKGKQLL